MTPDIGVELINPKAGTRQVFTATAASSGGREVQIEATYPPHSPPPPVHHHPSQEERFAVLGERAPAGTEKRTSLRRRPAFMLSVSFSC